MNDHPADNLDRSTPVEPAVTNDAERIADEQFAHGLLRFLHRDTRDVQDARVAETMRALREEIDQPAVVGRITVKRPSWRGFVAAAACLALVAVLVMLGMPTERTAHAMVQASIDASAVSGPRRYDVRAQRPFSDSDETESIATLDLLGADRMLFRAQTPDGHKLVTGRNPAGHWTIRLDGTIQRFDARQPWPRWAEFGDRTLLLESVDSLLEQLSKGYDLTYRPADPSSPDGSELLFDGVTAVRTDGPQQFPDRIELRIDPESHIVQRMELHWSFERLGFNPERMRRLRRMRDNAGGQQEPPGERRPEDLRPRMGRNGAPPPGAPGPPGEAAPDDQPPPRDRPNRPRLDDRPRPDDLRRPDPGPHDGIRPRFLDRPPEFREDRHMPPPRVIIFQLTEQPDFPENWFDPETHVD